MFNQKVDACVLFSGANRTYYTKMNTSFGCMLVTDEEKIFFTDFRYATAAESVAEDIQLKIVTFKELYYELNKELTRLGVKKIGYEDDTLTISEYDAIKCQLSNFELVPVGKDMQIKRSIKTDWEIEKITAAQKLSEKVLKNVMPLIKNGVTERDIAAEMIFEMIKGGADAAAFDTIVAFGENSAMPHHTPCDKKLEKGEMVLIDFGAKVNGYCSDMTRSFCYGDPSKELEKIHSVVLQAQNYVLKNLRAGMTCNEADALAREIITANGFGDCFGHSLGHGVGLEIHEFPRVGSGEENLLLPNMVVTVEPGIYVKGIGGVRIEDLVVIKENEIINLTNFNKNINI